MTRVPWVAVGWFVLTVIALGMAIRAFHAPAPGLSAQVVQGQKAPSAVAATTTVPPASKLQPDARSAQPAKVIPPQTKAAGVRLIKCVVHGQVTYTNNPQECPAGSASAVTVYPTQGYLPSKP